MIKKLNVVIVSVPGSLLLDTSAASDVFALANGYILREGLGESLPQYDIIFASPTEEKEIITAAGLKITCRNTIFDINDKIDTLLIGGLTDADMKWVSAKFISWLKINAPGIRRICVSGSAVTALAAAGLLNGKQTAVHWSLSGYLNDNFPALDLESSNLFVRKGNIFTCAGMSAVIDLCLGLIEEDMGRSCAMDVARTMVLYQRRPGCEPQFSTMLNQQLSGKKQISTIQTWIKANLKSNLKVELLADRAAMSPRNFARVFVAQTGFSPGRYIEQLRLESSKRYLEDTDMSLDQIAAECGFGKPDTMRKLYLRTMEMTPFNYRKSHLELWPEKVATRLMIQQEMHAG